MGGGIDIAGAIVSRALERAEVSAQNLANLTTVGYKSRRLFAVPVAPDSSNNVVNANASLGQVSYAQGELQKTGNPLDLAISGPGFFVVRSAQQTLYTRAGQFLRDSDGRIVTPDGFALQTSSGDAAIQSANPTILADGTILESGQPTARIETVTFTDPTVLVPNGAGKFSVPDSASAESGSAQIKQGMIEASNVSTASEMISIMAAVRSAEMGQHLLQVYGDLMDRATSAFGQS